jgi:hypothetical protein
MEPEEKFKEFTESLMSHGVRFMAIGGNAVIAYGHPCYTGGTDFLIEKSPENAETMLAATNGFSATNQVSRSKPFFMKNASGSSASHLIGLNFPASIPRRHTPGTSYSLLLEPMSPSTHSKI